MGKSKIDWARIQQECVLFDLSEYNPKLREDLLPTISEVMEFSEKELDNDD